MRWVQTHKRYGWYSVATANDLLINNVTFFSSFSVPLLEVKIEKESRAVSANKPQQVTCRAMGSSPPPRVSWWKAGARLQASHETVKPFAFILNGISIHGNQVRFQHSCYWEKSPYYFGTHSWDVNFGHLNKRWKSAFQSRENRVFARSILAGKEYVLKKGRKCHPYQTFF